MIKNKLHAENRIWSLLLTLVMMLTMTLSAMPVNAAEGGTISIIYEPPHNQSTDFKPYYMAIT